MVLRRSFFQLSMFGSTMKTSLFRATVCMAVAVSSVSLFAGNADDEWDIWGGFGKARGETKPIENGFAFDGGSYRVTTTEETDSQGVSHRRTVVRNVSDKPISARCLFDRFEFDGCEWDVYTQANSWQNESRGAWQRLNTGVETRGAGMSSSRGAAPVMAIWNTQAGYGEVFHLIASSGWEMHTLRNAEGGTKNSVWIETGVDSRHLDYVLKPGEEVALPEVLHFRFTNRLDLDCHKLHAWWNRRHPVSAMPSTYNTWMYRFDGFNADLVLAQVAKAKELGLDYFVLDAGWFGSKGCWAQLRGDWEEHQDGALGGRMAEISKAVRDAGMKFGFWMESESASPACRTMKEHPQWFFTLEGQHFFDFSNPEARRHMIEQTCSLLKKYNAGYIKQDFNQDARFDPTGRAFAGYHAGFAAYIAEVRRRNPGIYVNGCASGGMRMDLGRAELFDGFWLSDNQSPYHGLRIAKETMLRLPPRYVERWVVARSLEGIQPDYGGRDSRLGACDDALWSHIRTVSHGYMEAFTAGGPFCVSCDLTAFSERDFSWMRDVIASRRADSAFWCNAEGRILCDTPEVTVLQYSDHDLKDVRLFVVTERSLQNTLVVRPVLAPGEYLVDGKKKDLSNGLTVRMPDDYAASEIILKKL